MFVKICGLTEPSAIDAAIDAGADALGFVFAESPRRIEPSAAADLCSNLPDNVLRVAVMRHPGTEDWRTVRDLFSPDWLQTDAGDFDALDISSGCERLPVFRNGHMKEGPLPVRLLFEGTRSGSGEVADWSEAASIASQTRMILAGGLDPDNVTEAISRVAPWGVDVSSGVESSPGIKDLARIRMFIAHARAAEK